MATLKEVALELGYTEGNFGGTNWGEGRSHEWLNLDERYAVIRDDKGLHLTDAVSWARFSPRIIGRKSNVTRKGLEFQIAQLARYKKQIGA